MGSKQRRQLARARRREQINSMVIANLKNDVVERQVVIDQLKKKIEHAEALLGALGDRPGDVPMLQYNIVFGEYEIRVMSGLQREFFVRRHGDRLLKQLNEKYPPANEISRLRR